MIATIEKLYIDQTNNIATITVEYTNPPDLEFDQFYTFSVSLSSTTDSDIDQQIITTGEGYKKQYINPPPPIYTIKTKVGDQFTI